jgi:hypothetical protein
VHAPRARRHAIPSATSDGSTVPVGALRQPVQAISAEMVEAAIDVAYRR